MKMVKLASVAIAATLAVTGCKEIQIKDGRIPSEYLAVAAQYMGNYKGQFNGVPSEISLWLEGDVVKAKYTDAHGNDILDPQCESQIGNLKSITVSGEQKSPQLDVANFAFDPGKCSGSVLGRMLVLMFEKKASSLKMAPAILKRWDRCPWPECTNPDIDVYLRGEFHKTN
ncbi:MAG: hypothetical protein A4S09_12230 [Proteobacteria bacterium SG_bin7]|nr:MAG: hypothetical protein A4S09_12230 [Proteobacteria bacterium SG_bin7]